MVTIICEVEHYDKDYVTPLYNLRGNALVFPDRAHAEYFVETHKSVLKPDIVYRERNFNSEEIYAPYNVWEHEETFKRTGKRYE